MAGTSHFAAFKRAIPASTSFPPSAEPSAKCVTPIGRNESSTRFSGTSVAFPGRRMGSCLRFRIAHAAANRLQFICCRSIHSPFGDSPRLGCPGDYNPAFSPMVKPWLSIGDRRESLPSTRCRSKEERSDACHHWFAIRMGTGVDSGRPQHCFWKGWLVGEVRLALEDLC